MKRHFCPFLLPLLLIVPLLLCSCATSKALDLIGDPVLALSYSSEGHEPVAFAVIPPSFVLPALEELLESEDLAEAELVASFLNEFFGRADCVFASIMCNSDRSELFCRILALGKFPASAKMLLNSSRGWQKREADGMAWFELEAFTEGRALRAAIPASGALLAEIDITPPSSNGGTDAPSRSMADFIAAATTSPQGPQGLPPAQGAGAGGDGAAFLSSIDAALLGAANVPFAFYAPDFNLFVRSCLPAVPNFPLAGAVAALSAFEGFSLPISSVELAVDKGEGEMPEDGEALEALTVRVAVPSAALARAAVVIVQLMFPDANVAVENDAIVVTKELPAGSAALAVLSFFLVS